MREIQNRDGVRRLSTKIDYGLMWRFWVVVLGNSNHIGWMGVWIRRGRRRVDELLGMGMGRGGHAVVCGGVVRGADGVGAGGRPVVGSRVGVVRGALGGRARIDHLHHWRRGEQRRGREGDGRGGIAGLGRGWVRSGGGDGQRREGALGGRGGRLGGGRGLHVDLARTVAA
jgi:hypothetical protein